MFGSSVPFPRIPLSTRAMTQDPETIKGYNMADTYPPNQSTVIGKFQWCISKVALTHVGNSADARTEAIRAQIRPMI